MNSEKNILPSAKKIYFKIKKIQLFSHFNEGYFDSDFYLLNIFINFCIINN